MVLFRAASPLSRLLLERALGCPRYAPPQPTKEKALAGFVFDSIHVLQGFSQSLLALNSGIAWNQSSSESLLH